jgi:DNA-binding MarR family transcriptional regulator
MVVKLFPTWKYLKMEEFVLIPDQIAEKFLELFQRALSIRHNLNPPEHVVKFKQHLERFNPRGADLQVDFMLLLRVFTILEHKDAPPTMGEMSTELNIPLSSATRTVDWLVDANIVERINDPDDRRVVRVQLTETGHQLYRTEMEYRKAQVKRLLAHFSAEEQEQLLHLVRKALELLPSQNSGPTP